MKKVMCVMLAGLLIWGLAACGAPATPAVTTSATKSTTNSAEWEKQYRLGLDLLRQAGKGEEAMAALDSAIRIDKNRPEAWLAKADAIRSKVTDALDLLDKAQRETGNKAAFQPLIDELRAEAERQQDAVITWVDAEVEKLVRAWCGKPSGDIRRSDLDKIESVLIVADAPLIVNDFNFERMDWDKSKDGKYYMVNSSVEYSKKNNIRKLDDFANFRKLGNLTVMYSELSDLSGLKSQKQLGNLAISQTNVADVTALAGFSNLRNLDLSVNKITDITPLGSIEKLEMVKLYANAIQSIAPLAGGKEITYLDLWNNQIVDISPLAGMVKMQDLKLGTNKITDIRPLAGMQVLSSLGLEGNSPITDISTLAGLKNLQRVDIRGLTCDTSPVKDVKEVLK